jgi:alpha-beta hydrolase superfamily lysophospholipase
MFGGPISTHPALYAAASPTIYARGAGDTPLFLLHGETDTLVDSRQSSSYCEKATKLGAPARFRLVPDTLERGFHGMGMQPPLADLRADIIGFFDEHLRG